MKREKSEKQIDAECGIIAGGIMLFAILLPKVFFTLYAILWSCLVLFTIGLGIFRITELLAGVVTGVVKRIKTSKPLLC